MLVARNAKIAHVEGVLSSHIFGPAGGPGAIALRNWLEEHPDARIHFVCATMEPSSHQIHTIIWYEE